MAFLDKLKETANTVKDKASNFAEEQQLSEKLSNAKESVKKSWDEGTAAIKESNRENKELKQALEGAIIRYEVVYIGGLPEYPKAKIGAIGMNIMPDKFSFRKTGNSKDWFNDYDIAYDSISDIHIEKRTITNAEMWLGGGNDANQQQENNICITFTTEEGKELMLRVEMLTGTTIYAQAAKCREFMDVLRQNDILKRIQKNANAENSNNSSDGTDILKQIEKLASLKESGIITEEEFTQKKAVLLEKL